MACHVRALAMDRLAGEDALERAVCSLLLEEEEDLEEGIRREASSPVRSVEPLDASADAYLLLAQSILAAQGPPPSFADYARVPASNPFSGHISAPPEAGVRVGGSSEGADGLAGACAVQLTLSSMDPEGSLLSLPLELLQGSLARWMSGADVLALAQTCHALALTSRSDTAWREKLSAEMGFTEAGIALWQQGGHRLLEAYDYFHRKHEMIECSLLREPTAVRAPGWEGCYDLKLCMELVNPWPVDVWALFRVCAPGESSWPEETYAATSRLPLRRHSAQRLHCAGYAASQDRDVVLVSVAAAGIGHERTLKLSHRAVGAPLPSIGWMHDDARGDGAAGSDDDDDASVVAPAVQAMLLPAARSTSRDGDGGASPRGGSVPTTAGGAQPSGRHGPAMVVLGEHTVRIDAPTWQVAVASGTLCVEILHCTALHAYCGDSADSADSAAAPSTLLPLEVASPVELRCDAGAEVGTTAPRSHRKRGGHNRMMAGRDFEWRPSARRAHAEAAHRHDRGQHSFLSLSANEDSDSGTGALRGDTHVVEGGWEVADGVGGRPAPAADDLTPLSFVTLSRARTSFDVSFE